MPDLHCYVSEEVARKLRQLAKQAHLSTSQYLAQLVEREVEHEWPNDYFDVFGAWQGAPLERANQGSFEKRSSFD